MTGARVAPLDGDGNQMAGAAVTLDCDTIVLGVGAVPVVELLDALGCRTAFVPDRGGHVPLVDPAQMTSLAGIYAVGDCAGVWAAKSMDRGIAEAEGRRAVGHLAGADIGEADAVPAATDSLSEYRLAWVRAAVIGATVVPGVPEAHVCQCEEVTARDILEIRPPRYLGWQGTRRNSADLAALLGNGAPNPDQVKRLTRAGMGLCQGRRCREQVAALLALGAATPLSEVPLATYRAPVRPIPLGLAGTLPETPEMSEHWDIWFGIPGQATSYWDIRAGGETK